MPLFPREHEALLELLGGLDASDWERPTVNTGWSVRDIAAHLVADDLGRLSRQRDGHRPGSWSGDEPLGAFIDRQNGLWVEATRRLSPQVLRDLLRWSGKETQRFYETLDGDALGSPVSWAGPDPAPVWLDLARELTERWHHQQQIRDAVGAGLFDEPAVFGAVLRTFAFSLPVAMEGAAAGDRVSVVLDVEGAAGGRWTVLRDGAGWRLFAGAVDEPSARVTLDGDTAWRMYTRVFKVVESISRARIEGDRALGEALLRAMALIV